MRSALSSGNRPLPGAVCERPVGRWRAVGATGSWMPVPGSLDPLTSTTEELCGCLGGGSTEQLLPLLTILTWLLAFRLFREGARRFCVIESLLELVLEQNNALKELSVQASQIISAGQQTQGAAQKILNFFWDNFFDSLSE